MRDTVTIQVTRLTPEAKLPKYASAGAAGMDLASVEQVSLQPGRTRIIKTGLAIALPAGYELQIRSRSGLAAKHAVFVTNGPGTIDSDYRGEIGVILTNNGDEPFYIEVGDRIAQGVVMPVPRVGITEVTELSATVRGSGGFGHTGLN